MPVEVKDSDERTKKDIDRYKMSETILCQRMAQPFPGLAVQVACRNEQLTRILCIRFLSAASLQGLVQEGTMTSLCIAMTEEQHKSVMIDFSGPQLQVHNAGEIMVPASPQMSLAP